MKYPVFCWRDVIQGFGEPKLYLNEEMAKRDFGYRLNQEGSPMQYKPSDYELYSLGQYDTANGSFDLLPVPVYILNGNDVYGVNVK